MKGNWGLANFSTLFRRVPILIPSLFREDSEAAMKSALSHTTWSRVGWALALGGTLVLLVGAVLPPFVGPDAEHALRVGFQHLCHQLPGRSFEVGGVPLAVCHRCVGIYAGLLGGVLSLPVIRNTA